MAFRFARRFAKLGVSIGTSRLFNHAFKKFAKPTFVLSTAMITTDSDFSNEQKAFFYKIHTDPSMRKMVITRFNKELESTIDGWISQYGNGGDIREHSEHFRHWHNEKTAEKYIEKIIEGRKKLDELEALYDTYDQQTRDNLRLREDFNLKRAELDRCEQMINAILKIYEDERNVEKLRNQQNSEIDQMFAKQRKQLGKT